MINNIVNMFTDEERIRPVSKTKQTVLYPSLSQGKQFNKYQNKITRNLAKNANILSGKEGFTNSGSNNSNSGSNNFNSDSNSLTTQSNNIVSNNNNTAQQQLSVDILKLEYEDTLKAYQKVKSKISGDVSGYVDRVNPTNPYLNQNVMFSDGTIAYVTNQGVAKQYGTTDILQNTSGQNGCPGQNYVNINIPWDTDYKPGTIIPTTPSLLVGTPIVSGQSCGNEGNNVFVDKFIASSDASASYMGCYATSSNNDNMTFIGGSPSSSNSTDGTYTYQQCSQSAIQQGYQYFGLQNVNLSTSTGYCAVSNSNSDVSKYGTSQIPSQYIVLWMSNISNQTGNSAILSVIGSLSVVNSSGAAVYNTPAANATPSNYLGCYGDSQNRAMTLYNNGSAQYDLDQCQQAAQSAGNTYYALQNSTTGTNAQCMLSNSLSSTTKYGPATNCTDISGGTWSGGGWSNAVYNNEYPQSNYYLLLNDSGNMSIFRGTSPSDNQGLIWSSATDNQQQQPNPAMVAANGKYGQNWMASGSTLAAGDFVGSNDGSIALVMQTDGNLVLYTYQMVTNCQPMNDGNMGGGILANAVYDISKTSITKNIGQLAYVDSDSNLYNYPSTNQTYANEYDLIDNADTANNGIKGTKIKNATVDSCTNYCNTNSDCAGFVFQNNTCYPKTNKMYPYGGDFTNQTNSSIYVRKVNPLTPPSGVSQTTNNIDTITFQNYINKGAVGSSYGLSKVSAVPKQILGQLQTKMNSLSSQLTSLTGSYNSGSTSAQQQSVTNSSGVNTYMDELNQINKKMGAASTNNLQNILNDSDIIILQKNYDYLFWSILAIGTVLISMNVVKTNNNI
jgi:hypothetical protein